MRRRRSRSNTDYFAPHTCNTIDDVTGLKVKLKDTKVRWDNARVTDLNFENRQPQDFPVTPRPQKVYIDTSSEGSMAAPTPYDPANGWNDL